MRNILRKDLNLKSYSIPIVQELKLEDFDRRMNACSDLLDRIQEDHRKLDQLLMTDECLFSVDNSIATSHCRRWSRIKPSIVQQKPLQPQRQLVWCGITSSEVIGPYFFDGPVTAESYRTMIEDFLLPHLRRRRVMRTTIFQQDGAPAHTAKVNLQWLRRVFGNRVVSKGCDMTWPPRSPDLTPPDYFLWGYLKLKIRKRRPTTLEDLIRCILEEIEALNGKKQLLTSVFQNFVKRLRKCVESGGEHVID